VVVTRSAHTRTDPRTGKTVHVRAHDLSVPAAVPAGGVSLDDTTSATVAAADPFAPPPEAPHHRAARLLATVDAYEPDHGDAAGGMRLFAPPDAAVEHAAVVAMGERLGARFASDPDLAAHLERTWPGTDPHDAGAATARLVAESWAISPTNSPVGRATQQAAGRTFGIDRPLPERTDAGWVPHLDAEVATVFGDDNVSEWSGKAGPLLDAYVTEQYAVTQQDLADRGIGRVEVHRGMCWAEHDVPTGLRGLADRAVDEGMCTAETGVKSNALSSWSTDRVEAETFASLYAAVEHDGPTVQTVMTTTVPAWAVWSTPATGPGCADESEVVVLGGTGRSSGFWRHEPDAL
jgi:hypothetical protein